MLSVTWRTSSNYRGNMVSRALCTSSAIRSSGGLGDQTGVAWSLNFQGDVARDQGDSASARALYEQGLAIFREVDDRWGIAGTLADLGSPAAEKKDYSAARSMYRESIRAFQELDHRRGISRLLEYFACLAAAQLGEQSVPCDWRARPLRYGKISAPRSRLPNRSNWKRVCTLHARH